MAQQILARDVSLLVHFAGITDVGAFLSLPPAIIRDIIEIKCGLYCTDRDMMFSTADVCPTPC